MHKQVWTYRAVCWSPSTWCKLAANFESKLQTNSRELRKIVRCKSIIWECLSIRTKSMSFQVKSPERTKITSYDFLTEPRGTHAGSVVCAYSNLNHSVMFVVSDNRPLQEFSTEWPDIKLETWVLMVYRVTNEKTAPSQAEVLTWCWISSTWDGERGTDRSPL